MYFSDKRVVGEETDLGFFGANPNANNKLNELTNSKKHDTKLVLK
jgi:hypothetical protein